MNASIVIVDTVVKSILETTYLKMVQKNLSMMIRTSSTNQHKKYRNKAINHFNNEFLRIIIIL